MKTKTAVSASGFFLVMLLLGGVVMFTADDTFNNSLQGAFSMVDIAPAGFNYNPPNDVSLEDAQAGIVQAEADILEMKELNFITLFAEDSLKEAKQAMQAEDYPQVLVLTKLISFVKKEKIDFFDRIRLLEIKKKTLEERGIEDFDHPNEMMHDAMNAFSLDQLDDANKMLDKADDELKDMGKEHSRVKLLGLMSKNFLLRYWWQVLIVLIILGLSFPFIVGKIRKGSYKRKIKHYKIELNETKNVIKDLQRECFIDKVITTKTYQDRAMKYEERMTHIKHSIPVLEAKLRSEDTSFFGWMKRDKKNSAKGSSNSSSSVKNKSSTNKSSSNKSSNVAKKSVKKKSVKKKLRVKLGGPK